MSVADKAAPTTGLWDNLQQTAKQLIKLLMRPLTHISKRIEVATGHKFNLSKIVPITLALLNHPMPIILGSFASGAVVLIVHPSTIMKHPEIATNVAMALVSTLQSTRLVMP